MMIDSKHFRDMIKERNIPLDFVDMAIESPDFTEDKPDGTRHYLKKCENMEGRWLWVVVNEQKNPKQRITAFFDRRLRRKSK